MSTKTRGKRTNRDLLDARDELTAAKTALAARDSTHNRDRLTFAREMVDVLLDQALEAEGR